MRVYKLWPLIAHEKLKPEMSLDMKLLPKLFIRPFLLSANKGIKLKRGKCQKHLFWVGASSVVGITLYSAAILFA